MDDPVLAIPSGLEELLPQFLAEMDADLSTLRRLAGGDRRAFAEHVHAMCGKCMMFGAMRAAAALARLEQAAMGGDGLAGPAAAAAQRLDEVGRQAAGWGRTTQTSP